MTSKFSGKSNQIDEPLPVTVIEVTCTSLDTVGLLGALVDKPPRRFRGYLTKTVFFHQAVVQFQLNLAGVDEMLATQGPVFERSSRSPPASRGRAIFSFYRHSEKRLGGH